MNSEKVGYCWQNVKVSSLFVILSVFFSVLFLVGVSPAFATHDSSANLQPEWSAAGMNMDYTVEISNSAGSDPIDEVRIFRALDYSDFDCEPKTGWELIDNLTWYDADLGGLTKMCWYYTLDSSYNIQGGSSTIFEFSATVPDEGCDHKWKFETRDEASESSGDWQIIYDYTSVDDKAPNVTKEIVGLQNEKDGSCPPESNNPDSVCWITQSTEIQITVTDDGFCGTSGLDFCEVTYTLDGSSPITETYEKLSGKDSWYYEMTFDEDSLHVLNVTCYDIAGNKLEDIEVFRVDDTPPETTKKFIGPQKPWLTEFGLVEWIDGVTTVKMTAVDPEAETTPEGVDCSIGVDKTLYINVLAKEYDDVREMSCWEPEEYCQPIIPEPDTECVMEVQDFCEEEMGYAKYSTEWVDCVEREISAECMSDYVGPMWQVYNGTPIEKDQESCHILQYYSIDELGNKERTKVNCFFVDKTAPEVYKDNGNAINDSGEDAFKTEDNPDGTFHWITSDMPITFTCTDQEPHPSGDEQLCYKVSYDYVYNESSGEYEWGYVTEDYPDCDAADLTEDGYCCVSADPENPFVFYFNEDEESMHNLEYYCIDAVEKKSIPHIQYYKVDDTPPTINKTMIGTDHLGYRDGELNEDACPPKSADDTCYVADNGLNGVRIDVEDGGEICAVNNVMCVYELWWKGNIIDSAEFGEEGVDIIFTEDSEHTLVVNCADNLENEMEEDVEVFLVDSKPPVTTKTYDDTSIVRGDYRWMTSAMPITMTAEDEKVGVDKIIYRVTNVGTHMCPEVCQETGDGDWTEVPGNSTEFYIGDESCHFIEFKSVDKLGNMEILNTQCVMVDNTPPKGYKIIGDPRLECELDMGEEEETSDCVTTRTYTLDADFDEGTLIGLEHETVSDQLQLSSEFTTLPFIWVPNSNEGTVSKYDTITGNELGRYRTGPSASGNPSRTTVDQQGNVWFGNRMTGTVVKIGLYENGACVDKNGNGTIETSMDTNMDTDVITSEVLAWGQDECQLFEVLVGGSNSGVRGLAIDANNDLWAGTYSLPGGNYFYHIDGDTGVIKDNISISPYRSYGAVIDAHGNIWSSTLYPYVLKIDPVAKTITKVDLAHTSYGLGIDDNDHLFVAGWGTDKLSKIDVTTNTVVDVGQQYDTHSRGVAVTSDGNVWVVNSNDGDLTRLNNTLDFQATIDLGSGVMSTGAAVDAAGKVWACNYNDGYLHRIDPATNTIDLSKQTPGISGAGVGKHYSYSDMTGVIARMVTTKIGTWTVVFDAEYNDTTFETISWNANLPANTSMTVKVRSSDDQTTWSAWETVTNGVALSTTPNGQYLEIKTTMQIMSGDVSPELYDLTVETSCGSSTPDCWWVRDHVTEITLECEDQGDHPVGSETPCYKVSYDYVYNETTSQYDWGYITNQYCTEFGGTMEGDWCCADEEDPVPYVFKFTEDSIHNLEFYCVDHLGNTEETTDLEYFKVDSVAPTTTKTYLGAYHFNETTGAKYIDTNSWIELTAEDGGPICAVGVNETQYRVSGALADKFCQPANCDNWMTTIRPDIGPWQTYNGIFGIEDESCHVIEYRSIDLLGNTEDIQWQCVYVDKTPPVTTKTYEGPQYLNPITEDSDSPYWITSDTEVILVAEDSEPHPSGVKETYFRDVYLENEVDWEYCYSQAACDLWNEDPRFGLPTAPEPYNPNRYVFSGLEESCHILEYYSVDNVNKTEDIKWQCVFVDNSAPEPVKTVGKPSELWDGMTNGRDSIYYPGIEERCNNQSSDNPIDCWKVTLLTPITMECFDDDQDHPVPEKEICYQITWDGDDVTEDRYCTEEGLEMVDGWCCGKLAGTTLYFGEETEHNLKFYCVDALGNSNENVDDEMFKVEGTAFEIELNKKWNLISVPLVMLDDSIDDVFKDVADTVDSVWTYDPEAPEGEEWSVYTPGLGPDTLTEMTPGWGYWVYSSEDSTLLIGGSLFSPAKTPPAKNIVAGWNLIGYWGTEGELGYDGPDGVGKTAYCELYSLGNDLWDKEFSSLWSYWEPYNPSQWISFTQQDQMDPGAGYWVHTNQEGEFVPPTYCT